MCPHFVNSCQRPLRRRLRGRYEVTLDSSTAGSEPLGIKPANLKLVQRNKLAGEGCSHCGVLEGKLLRCTRCLRAQYCSKVSTAGPPLTRHRLSAIYPS